ncbi:MAG: DNA primase, partial [Bacteroidota bacterium]
MIPKEVVDEIKSRADVLEVIGDYVNLKKNGSNFRGYSPFNNERTPSFYVVPSKGFFKDFSSGKAGDSITFLMEAEGMSYVESIKHLAKKYGIDIPEEEATDEELAARNERDSVFIVMKYAAEYYQNNLWKHEEGQSIGLTYLHERGFSNETIQAFSLGYSLDQWDGLMQAALKKGYQKEYLAKAGLIIQKEESNKEYDRFRGRVMFPVHNISGRVLAFGARVLGKGEEQRSAAQPKYINSPETLIYHKSDVLYGLYQAKQTIRQEDNCYLVEGYTDVISLYQAGVQNAVASSGTSLTQEQIRLIGRYTQNVTVLFDGDSAGLKASFRGIDMLLEGGLQVKAVTLPEGEDPDSLSRRLSTSELQAYLREHRTDFIGFKTRIYQKEAEADPIRQAELIKEVVSSIAKVPDPIQRQVYIKTTSSQLEIDEQTLISEMNKI